MPSKQPALQESIQRAEALAGRLGHVVCRPEHLIHELTIPNGAELLEAARSVVGDVAGWRDFLLARLRGVPKSSLAGRYIDHHDDLLFLLDKADEFGCEETGPQEALAAYFTLEEDELRDLFSGLRLPRFEGGAIAWPDPLPSAPAKKPAAAPDDEEEGPAAYGEWGVDLTAMVGARTDRLIVGRNQEVRQLVEILLRNTKPNPVLVGAPGVGKTAIVELLCQKIVRDEVPPALHGVRIVEVNMTDLVANAQYRGQFEARLKELIEWAKAHREDTIVFIDELHTIVGAGGSEGKMDAANILKPALARGEFRCIGATTHAEYTRYILKDKALSRRFARVQVDEPGNDDTLDMLYGVARSLQEHHGYQITPEALRAAVYYSSRYIRNQYHPDKAIDILDRTVARVRIRAEFTSRRLARLEQERASLLLRRAPDSQERPEPRIEELEAQIAELRGGYEVRREGLEEVKEAFRAHLEARRAGEEDATRAYQDYVELAGKRGISIEVLDADVATTITEMTGIPVGAVESRDSAQSTLDLAEDLAQQVIGQRSAIEQVSLALQRQRAGLKRGRRPAGAFLFLGSTGVGKTELAKAMGRWLFGSDDALVRLDMSEYKSSADVSKLIGASPMYVGYEEGGALTEAIRKRPFAIVLFDEIEKAHPTVLTVLLQLLDDGRLTDGQGTEHDFSNAVVVLTSNIGQDRENLAEHVADAEMRRRMYRQAATRALKPEFLNRLDVIVFDRLEARHAARIAEIELSKLKRHAAAELNLELGWGDDLLNHVVEHGFSSAYGARSIVHAVRMHVENPLALRLLQSRAAGVALEKLEIEVVDGGVVFRGPEQA